MKKVIFITALFTLLLSVACNEKESYTEENKSARRAEVLGTHLIRQVDNFPGGIYDPIIWRRNDSIFLYRGIDQELMWAFPCAKVILDTAIRAPRIENYIYIDTIGLGKFIYGWTIYQHPDTTADHVVNSISNIVDSVGTYIHTNPYTDGEQYYHNYNHQYKGMWN